MKDDKEYVWVDEHGNLVVDWFNKKTWYLGRHAKKLGWIFLGEL